MTDLPQTIARLRKLMAKATPGPWVSDRGCAPLRVFSDYILPGKSERIAPVVCETIPYCGDRRPQGQANADLIAAMQSALPGLLDALESRAPAPLVELTEAADELERMAKYIYENRDNAITETLWHGRTETTHDALLRIAAELRGQAPVVVEVTEAMVERALIALRAMPKKAFGSHVAAMRAALEAALGQGDAQATPSLIAAAHAVINRWGAPLWKDVGPTADCINALRRCLAEHEKGKNK